MLRLRKTLNGHCCDESGLDEEFFNELGQKVGARPVGLRASVSLTESFRRSRRRIIQCLLVTFALTYTAALQLAIAAEKNSKGPGKGGGGAGLVPVSVALVERTNLPIYLDGLGT